MDRAVLWRLAYAFLRLDQLPSGGWGRSLSGWLNAVQGHRAEQIIQPRDVHKKGGIALTGLAFWSLTEFFFDQLSSAEEVRSRYTENKVARRVLDFFIPRIGVGGGIDVESQIQYQKNPKICHTLTALIVFIEYRKAMFGIEDPPEKEATMLADYLIKRLPYWEDEIEYRPFGLYCTTVQLRDLLDIKRNVQFLEKDKTEALVQQLDNVLPKMAGHLLQIHPYPFFHKEEKLKRSDFIFHLTWLLTTRGDASGEKYNLSRYVDDVIKQRLPEGLRELLNTIQTKIEKSNPTASLVDYYPSDFYTSPKEIVKDWGLSAEVAAALSAPGVKGLLNDFDELVEKTDALNWALVTVFNRYYDYREVFRFTHGISFGLYMRTLSHGQIDYPFEALDSQIEKTLSSGVTEKSLWELVVAISLQPSGIAETEASTPTNAVFSSRKDLLMDKLESGEHTPNGTFCPESEWRNLTEAARRSTIDFFNGPAGRENDKHNTKRLVHTFTSRIVDFVTWEITKEKRALDVGCGSGAYAWELAEMGFTVDLLDNSSQMIKLAKDRFKNVVGLVTEPRTFTQDLLDPPPVNYKYDVIFAGAVIFHIPRKLITKALDNFFRWLKPEGLLFVNIKVRDHSLISLDGRFFEYYQNHMELRYYLEEAGFRIEEIVLRDKEKNMYKHPHHTMWANYYCLKP